MGNIQINCAECIKGNHNGCNKEECLCRLDEHGNKPKTLNEGAKVSFSENMNFPDNEPQEYEKSQRLAERCWELETEGPNGNSLEYAMKEYAETLVFSKHMVGKHDLKKELDVFNTRYAHQQVKNDDDVETAINATFEDMDTFRDIKKIARYLGQADMVVNFAPDQIFEVAEWIIGRYHIKRIDLTGGLLFHNGKHYQTETTETVQRAVRNLIPKARSKDVVEVVKYVEQSCPLITWKDVEKSIHLKCMNNGTFDVERGVFSSTFDPANIILNQIPHDFVTDETFMNWDGIRKILQSIIVDGQALQSYYDFLSTCFHPYTGVDFQFNIVGGAGTGKSQLGVLAELAVGEDNVGDATIHSIASDPTTQKNMAFKMLNIDNDMSADTVARIEVLKKWITQDKFTARGIYEQATTFRPMSRMMGMTNDLYEIPNENDAEAIYDRTYALEVNKKYRHEATEIKNIMKKTATTEELNAFVTFLLKNASWVAKNEKFHHPLPVDQVEKIWNAFGNKIRGFIQRYTVPSGKDRVVSGDVFNLWLNYCHLQGFKSKDKKKFTKIFDEIIGNSPTKTRVNGNEVYAYSGFRMKTPEELKKDSQTILSDM